MLTQDQLEVILRKYIRDHRDDDTALGELVELLEVTANDAQAVIDEEDDSEQDDEEDFDTDYNIDEELGDD